MRLFKIDAIEPVLKRSTHILPVNVTYYPVRARENILIDIARRLVDDLPERLLEELMTEGSMLLSGVDIDVRFGRPIPVSESLKRVAIAQDICSTSRLGFDDPIASRNVMRREALALMNRYMSAIYSMTTVNHDHLFASVLKHAPFGRIDRADLCRRVFLLAARLRETQTLHLNRQLAADQLHLLTDDRLGIAADFIALALEKGNLRQGRDASSKIGDLSARLTASTGRASTTRSMSWRTPPCRSWSFSAERGESPGCPPSGCGAGSGITWSRRPWRNSRRITGASMFPRNPSRRRWVVRSWCRAGPMRSGSSFATATWRPRWR